MKSGRLHPSLSRISSLPPAPPSISFTPSLSPSLSSFPSATLSFPFCLHLIILLPLPPSLPLLSTSTRGKMEKYFSISPLYDGYALLIRRSDEHT